ncbi:MAG: hypothetical protein ABI743_10730, partial [bacterium]
VGQRLKLDPVIFAANGDRRYDDVAWTSDNARVISVTNDGRMRNPRRLGDRARSAAGTAGGNYGQGGQRKGPGECGMPNSHR